MKDKMYPNFYKDDQELLHYVPQFKKLNLNNYISQIIYIQI